MTPSPQRGVVLGGGLARVGGELALLGNLDVVELGGVEPGGSFLARRGHPGEVEELASG